MDTKQVLEVINKKIASIARGLEGKTQVYTHRELIELKVALSEATLALTERDELKKEIDLWKAKVVPSQEKKIISLEAENAELRKVCADYAKNANFHIGERIRLEAELTALRSENKALKKDSDLTITYVKGVEDGKDKMREKIHYYEGTNNCFECSGKYKKSGYEEGKQELRSKINEKEIALSMDFLLKQLVGAVSSDKLAYTHNAEIRHFQKLLAHQICKEILNGTEYFDRSREDT